MSIIRTFFVLVLFTFVGCLGEEQAEQSVHEEVSTQAQALQQEHGTVSFDGYTPPYGGGYRYTFTNYNGKVKVELIKPRSKNEFLGYRAEGMRERGVVRWEFISICNPYKWGWAGNNCLLAAKNSPEGWELNPTFDLDLRQVKGMFDKLAYWGLRP